MKYFGNWSDWKSMADDLWRGKYNDDIQEYEIDPPADAPKDDEIIFAAYGTPSYEGYAIVIYERDGKLYEMNGSHCSCYGLEETMGKPEETSREALKIRKFSSYEEYGDDALKRFDELFKS